MVGVPAAAPAIRDAHGGASGISAGFFLAWGCIAESWACASAPVVLRGPEATGLAGESACHGLLTHSGRGIEAGIGIREAMRSVPSWQKGQRIGSWPVSRRKRSCHDSRGGSGTAGGAG